MMYLVDAIKKIIPIEVLITSFWTSVLGGILTRYFFKLLWSSSKDNGKSVTSPSSSCGVVVSYDSKLLEQEKITNDNPRVIVLIRTDLPMTRGKSVAQVCHAITGLWEKHQRGSKELKEKWNEWERLKCPIEFYKVSDEDTLKKFHHRAKELMIMSQSIRDAGRTQISPGTKTVVGFGPVSATLLGNITESLTPY